MNTQRIIVLGFALVAAGGAAFLVRGILGGGAQVAAAKPAPQIALSEVLVANVNLTPGQALSAEQIRWEKWPSSTVDPSFFTRAAVGNETQFVKNTVVRAMILPGQPITKTAIVHGDASGFMAATLGEGMRAISISISTDSGAGGFILPNDRVDVILTRKPEGSTGRGVARTILSNVRVLAVDQTYRQEKDTRTVIGKTATVELAPEQAEVIAAASQSGLLSLALRPLTDGVNADGTDKTAPKKRTASAYDGAVSIIRYGITGTANRQEPQ
ncbi:MAG TPA: Flp pilus assembly protein CpaB [Rhizomicrobium sp.]|nr:Flp pilus assembly protein CpaB [Rhizomicrobium sp.]